MINVSNVVREIIIHDEFIFPAFQQGVVNLSRYARKIKPNVESLTKKTVEEKTIVVALSRLQKQFKKPERRAPFSLYSLSVQSDLMEISYEKTQETMDRIKSLYNEVLKDSMAFLTITQGINEVTIAGERKVISEFREKLSNAKPMFEKGSLSGITAKFSKDFLNVPNVIHTLVTRLARKEVNIVEIVSTLTELTFIIDSKNVQVAMKQLSQLL